MNKLKKNSGLSSAATSIFIPLFSLNYNTFKTGLAFEQLSFELSLFSSPSLELSSARLLYYLLHQSLDLLDLSFALDWLSPGRLLLSDVAETWFTESSSSALELSDPREDLS